MVVFSNYVSFSLDVSVPTIRVDNVWGLNYNGSGLRIAIIDSGINQSHPDLDDLDDNPSTSDPKVIAEQDFTGEGITVDSDGHGTHCAGIAAGTGAASNGVYKGVAPGAWLLEARVRNSTGGYDVNWLTDAIDWAVSNDADVISFSLRVTHFYPNGTQIRTDGTYQPSPAADEAVEQGVVFVAMAGNFNVTDNPENYITAPGDAFNVITVGASDDKNTEGINDDTIPWWSSRGPTGDNRFKPDVVAPGVNVYSPDPVGAGGYYPGDYGDFSGTSAATPHVAGVAALLLQAHPGWTPGIVKSVIMGTARLNDNLQAMPQRENDRGKGIVDAERAVLCATDIPVDQAESKYEYGYGDYTAHAYLNGLYDLSAGTEHVDPPENYAIATLNKSFVPQNNLTNPKFFFGFRDKGYMDTHLGWANFLAIFKLFAPDGSLLFGFDPEIHYENGTAPRYFDDYHTIDFLYPFTLPAQQTYTIEYGFSTYAYEAYSDFDSLDRGVQALAIALVDLVGVGNPSFEERLKSVYEPAYWNWTDIDEDNWRELKGDVNGDGIVEGKDLYAVSLAYGSEPGDPNWDPDCDLNGDDIVDGQDLYMVAKDYGKEANRVDGSYSWYTTGNNTYNMTQWLCDHDVNALKGQQVTFSFHFKPNGIGNNATAKITYIIENQSETTISGNCVYATEGWHNATVTTTLPADTVAIKVIIHFTDNFQTWIDKATIVTS